MYHIAEVGPERPDLERHPAFSGARGYRCKLGPGDVLFVPAFWWHHVRSNDVAISLSFWWPPEVRQYLAPEVRPLVARMAIDRARSWFGAARARLAGYRARGRGRVAGRRAKGR